MIYRAYFEFKTKKYKQTVDADSAKDVKEKIKNEIVFHKISREPVLPEGDDLEHLKNLFGIKGFPFD